MANLTMFGLVFGLLILVMLFVILDKGSSGLIFNDTLDSLNETNTTFSQGVRTTFANYQNAWLFFPLILFIGLIFHAFTSSQGD